MTDFAALLAGLAEHNVSFIVVGGAAAIVHGSSRLTLDLDIVYERSNENLDNLVAALSKLKPYLRGATARHEFHLGDFVGLDRSLIAVSAIV